MRLLLCLCLGLACDFAAQEQASTESKPVDPCTIVWCGQGRYGLSTFRAMLGMTERGVSITFNDAAVRSAGDGLSVAILKIAGREELLTPVFIRAYLRLAQTAFSQPELIACAPDKNPDVTLFLLDYLREHVDDKDLLAQIDAAKGYVVDQTTNTASH